MKHLKTKPVTREFPQKLSALMNGINCHGIKRALPETNERSIEESLVPILISLCNLYKGNIGHLKSLTKNLLIIVRKSHACFDKECRQILRNAAPHSKLIVDHGIRDGINCHGIKRALPETNERSIEEGLVPILISLCNLYKGNIGHLKSLTKNLLIIVRKSHACFDKECRQILRNADPQTSLDDLLRRLEEAFDALVIALGPSAGMTPAQIMQAQTDMHALIVTIEGIEHRDIEAQTGAERIVREIMQLLNDFGTDPQFPTSDTPTALDAALEALCATLDGALEVYGPQYGLDSYTISRLEDDLATIELHIKDIEHGRTPLTDGLVVIVDDIFNLLRDIGVPVLPIESAVGLPEKSAYLRRQLETVLAVSHSRRSELPEPSFGRIRKLEFDLLALGGGRDEVTLFEVVFDMNMVAIQFVGLL